MTRTAEVQSGDKNKLDKYHINQILLAIPTATPHQKRDILNICKGDRVRVFENSNDCVGQVIVQGNNQKQCQDTLNEVLKNIRIKLK